MALPATKTLQEERDSEEFDSEEPRSGEGAPEDAPPVPHAPPLSLAARGGLGLIRFYQTTISPLTPPACRFQPTCSQYTLTAIKRHGFVRGSWLGTLRILRCHPFHPGGHDPVP